MRFESKPTRRKQHGRAIGRAMIPDVTPKVLVSGIAFGDQPRWHDGRLWFSDWGPG